MDSSPSFGWKIRTNNESVELVDTAVERRKKLEDLDTIAITITIGSSSPPIELHFKV